MKKLLLTLLAITLSVLFLVFMSFLIPIQPKSTDTTRQITKPLIWGGRIQYSESDKGNRDIKFRKNFFEAPLQIELNDLGHITQINYRLQDKTKTIEGEELKKETEIKLLAENIVRQYNLYTELPKPTPGFLAKKEEHEMWMIYNETVDEALTEQKKEHQQTTNRKK